jgi:hypothetical protein
MMAQFFQGSDNVFYKGAVVHRTEFPERKAESREVVIRYTDRNGASRQRQIPLTNLAAMILNSVNQSVPKRDREENARYQPEVSAMIP